MVPNSVRDPLAYYRNNTVNSGALFECTVKNGVRHVIFSSTAAGYGNTTEIPVEGKRTLRLVEADERNHAARRRPRAWSRPCDPALFQRRQRRSALPPWAIEQGRRHLIKVAVETALGLRPKIEVFGSDYPTPDGSCIRDYIESPLADPGLVLSVPARAFKCTRIPSEPSYRSHGRSKNNKNSQKERCHSALPNLIVTRRSNTNFFDLYSALTDSPCHDKPPATRAPILQRFSCQDGSRNAASGDFNTARPNCTRPGGHP